MTALAVAVVSEEATVRMGAVADETSTRGAGADGPGNDGPGNDGPGNDGPGSDGDGRTGTDPLDPARRRFVEDFGALWAAGGAPRMEGRVLAFLMVASAPISSSADLALALGASAGSVSTTTRHLADAGFIQLRSLPGDRAHYFTVDDDVWGTWLATERRYLGRQAAVIDRAIAAVAEPSPGLPMPGSPGAPVVGEGRDRALRRLRNGRNYMRWLQGYHEQMLREWREYKVLHQDDGPGDPR